MRVLVVGAGGVGGYFGGRLLDAGGDVTFLVRPARRARLVADGLSIRSPLGDVTLQAATVLAEEIDRHWDLVVLSCKAYDLDSAIASCAPAVGPKTMVLPLLNGMAHLDALDTRFGRERVLGGLCAIAVTVDADGAIHHLNDRHTLAFGERDGGTSERTEAIAALFAPAKVKARLSPGIMLEMWEKWVFLAAAAAATCLMRASIGDIVTAGGIDFMTGLLEETGSVAKAEGFTPRSHVVDQFRSQMTARDSTLTASMLRDIERRGEVEADHVIGELLNRGHSAACAVPLLSTAYLHLKSYQARRLREAAAGG